MEEKNKDSLWESDNNIDSQNNKKRKPLWTALMVISLILFAGCIAYVLFATVSCNDGYNTLSNRVSATLTVSSESEEGPKDKAENPINFDKLKSINEDIAAWIKIEDTNINYPVLRAPADDQSYYLHRDYNRDYLYAGSIYMESYNQPDFTDRDTILYGHNMMDGSMFADLHKFENEDFFNRHKTMYIYTPDSVLTYYIYSAYEYDDRHINNSFDHFVEDDVFKEYIEYSLNPKSAIVSNVRKNAKVTIEDKLVTLSTCTNYRPENRFLVQGVLIKDEKTQ